MFTILFLSGQDRNPPTLNNEWMGGKYGLMVHWLTPPYNIPLPGKLTSPFPQKGSYVYDLNQAVDNFDLKGFLDDFDQTGASWLIFPIGQNGGTYASPNSIIDSLAGPGHTPKRDLVLEIAKAIKQRGKRFIAYIPCEVKGNVSLHSAFDWDTAQNTEQRAFQQKYLWALKEWALRLGKNLDGWWLDGCYTWSAFPNKYMKWSEWYTALRAGNPETLVTFNDGSFCIGITKPIVPEHDFTSGETEWLIDGKIRLGREFKSYPQFMPETAYVPGTNCLYHALLPIDCNGNWGYRGAADVRPNNNTPPNFTYYAPVLGRMPPPTYSNQELLKFVQNFIDVKGAVTMNVGIFQEGRLGEQTIRQLTFLKKKIVTNQ